MAHVAPTPRDVLWRDGCAALYRFRRPEGVRPAAAMPVLVVPSMINKWYVVDLRAAGAPQVGLLGYCMGATLAGIYTALEQKHVGALINLAGPFDFAHGGLLRTMVDPKWFDATAIAEAGNVGPNQMQSGFVALRPTAQIAKWMGFL